MKNVSIIKAFWARFRANDAGAVTVDYVVVTAALVALSIAVLGSVSAGTTDLGEDVGTRLAKLEMWGEEGPGGPPPE